MTKTRILAISSAILVLAIAGAAIGALVTSRGSSNAEPTIKVVDQSQSGATPQAFDTAAAAFADASRIAGFEVLAPAQLPANWAVTTIGVSPKGPQASTFRTVTITLRGATDGATLIEVNEPSQTFDGQSRPAAGPGGQFSSSSTLTNTTYSLVTDNRTYSLTVPLRSPIDATAAAKIMGSLNPD